MALAWSTFYRPIKITFIRYLSGEDAHDFRSDACEVNLPGASDVLRDAISQKIREEISELKLEILLLKEEVTKKQAAHNLPGKQEE